MGHFQAFEKGIEVNGTTIMSVVEGMGGQSSMGLQFLEEAGLTDVVGDDQHWYSQQKWLDAFRNISEKIGPFTLLQIGRKIPENAVFPPEIDDIVKALSAIDVAYHLNHRNAAGQVLFDPATGVMLEGIGHYGFEKVADKNKAILECQNPYPCDFDRGIIHTMAMRFNNWAAVVHDDDKPCRKDGADSCTYVVTWK